MTDNEKRGYFGVGVYRPKTKRNTGILWRTAQVIGADFIFTIQERHERLSKDIAIKQATDTMNAWKHVPYMRFESVEQLIQSIPLACLVGIELDPRATNLEVFSHPERAIYLLGAEDDGLPTDVLNLCKNLVVLPTGNLNVAVAGSIVLYDRIRKLTLDQ